MSWIENVNNWRQLPPEEKLLRRWRSAAFKKYSARSGYPIP
ncbi:MAG: hypothetical protein ACOYOL_12865 [Chthoniobacterales bacterium]|jgi:hypothetical protein